MSVIPLRLSPLTDPNDLGFPSEIQPAIDFLAMAGIDLENLGTHLISRNLSNMIFQDPATGSKTLTQLAQDQLVKVSSNDTTANYLLSKLVAGGGITLTEQNNGANENILVSSNLSQQIYCTTFVDNAGALNSWMGISDDGIASDASPLIQPFNTQLIAWAFGNNANGTDTDIEIYKNGTGAGQLVATYPVRNSRYAWASNITPVTFNAGERCSVFLRDQGGNANDVWLNLFFRLVNATTSAGSGNI